MWDTAADVAAIEKDFYDTFFGTAAGPLVEAWWDECEKALGAATIHCHEDWLVDHVYTVDFTRRLHAYVQKAAGCVMTPKQKEHFDAFALIADHLEAIAARNAAEERLDYAEAVQQARRTEDDDAKLAAIYSFFIGLKTHPDFNNGWMERFQQLAQMTNGTKEALVAKLPLEARFKRDRFNEGVVAQWYQPALDDRDWGTKDTFTPGTRKTSPRTPRATTTTVMAGTA